MRVFISWSGDRSKSVALALRDWLPTVIQQAEPWMSDSDIDPGALWNRELESQLAETRFGIICLTPENLSAPWVLFEAGALSKTVETAFVCPYLFDINPSQITGPLSRFQAVRTNQPDTLKLLKSINSAFGENALTTNILETAFQRGWPDLEAALSSVPAIESPEPMRSEADILAEILELVRQQSRVIGSLSTTASLWAFGSELTSFGQRTQSDQLVDSPFKSGDHVRHKQFGEGIVVSTDTDRGDPVVTVAFKGAVGTKRLLLSYAPLDKLT